MKTTVNAAAGRKRLIAETPLDRVVLERIVELEVERFNTNSDRLTYLPHPVYATTYDQETRTDNAYHIELRRGADAWSEDGTYLKALLVVDDFKGCTGVMDTVNIDGLDMRLIVHCNDIEQDIRVSWQVFSGDTVRVLSGDEGTIGEAFNNPQLMVVRG